MRSAESVTKFSVGRPRLVTGVMVLVTAALALVAVLPSVWPETFSRLHPVEVDTDPENMLSGDEPVRVYHHQMKKELSLYDMVVVGIVNESHPDGVFNPQSLRKIYELTEYAKTLRWDDGGVIEIDVIAPSTVDNIEQGGPGVVRFEWLMPSPPATKEEALAVRAKAERIPFLKGTVLSEDGKALCLYLPLTSKDLSYRVYSKLQEKIASLAGEERYFVTGLPVAEDTFGVEMFKQMAISAPIAMVVIFLLMLMFFRKFIFVVSPMIVAMVSVICTMGLLIATGNTVHIMSSMIPIFIMPIAVLDAVHILSEFFDRYQEMKDRRKTVVGVMDTLFVPMLYTSLTTAVGFASLALTPIPPVQTFGLFVAFGVMTAWVWTIMFIPAFVMFIPERWLENFGTAHHEGTESGSLLIRLLGWVGRMTYRYARIVMAVTAVAVIVAVYGIGRIRINDNPIKWFRPSHPIRVADKVLNKHFGGTYMAYLTLEAGDEVQGAAEYARGLSGRASARAGELKGEIPASVRAFEELKTEAARLGKSVSSKKELLDKLRAFADGRLEGSPHPDPLPKGEGEEDYYDAWDEALLFVDIERQRDQLLKQPEVLRYISDLQELLLGTGVVGKSNSLTDIVKTVHRELFEGKKEQFRIPDKPAAVAQCLITYQNSHRPQDLWHFVTPDYKKTSIWVQLRSGDNKDMARVIEAVDDYVKRRPPPLGMKHNWFGLTYINVVWQDKMVSGMLQAFLGSFLIVLLMMTMLYRSALWGLLSMVPLLVTVGLIYGVIGLVGKDYDMPVAVLSSLSLGLAVDYAIHFLSRSRGLRERHGSWSEAAGPVFGEPALAIARNVVVVGVGFLPLLAAPLVPYQTVGMFIAAILVTAGVASLLILPAMITLLEKWLFPATQARAFTCKCGTCVVSAVTIVALAAVNVHQFLEVGWTSLTWLSLIAVVVLIGICGLMSRRESCRRAEI